MGKLLESIGTFLLVLLLVIALFTFMAPNFGWSLDAVRSGSMEPEISTGDLVVTKPVSTDEIKVGDIITFSSPSNKRITTHRVMAVEKTSPLQFQTKGDANEDADPYMVPAKNVVGKVCLKIPYFGYVSQFIKTPIGFVLTFCIPGIMIILLEVRKLWQARDNNKDMEKGT
ncbi:MAG: signal peptidase I [Methanococcoides sp.]|nr:signal peptidase I [Methanococcoides sp.]